MVFTDMYSYRPQLPNLNTPVYHPRAVRSGMLKKINEIAVDTSVLNTPKGVYIPDYVEAPGVNALWVSAKINGFRMNQGPLDFLGEKDTGHGTWAHHCHQSDLYGLVAVLNQNAGHHGWSFELQRIDTWEKVLLAMLEGWTVMVGHSVYESFSSVHSVVPMPKPGEALLGGHIVNMISFDQEGDTAQMLGNMGMKVGRRGFFTYRGSYLRNLGICRDFFVLIPRFDHAN